MSARRRESAGNKHLLERSTPSPDWVTSFQPRSVEDASGDRVANATMNGPETKIPHNRSGWLRDQWRGNVPDIHGAQCMMTASNDGQRAAACNAGPR